MRTAVSRFHFHVIDASGVPTSEDVGHPRVATTFGFTPL